MMSRSGISGKFGLHGAVGNGCGHGAGIVRRRGGKRRGSGVAQRKRAGLHNLVKRAGLPWGGTRATGGSVGCSGEFQSD